MDERPRVDAYVIIRGPGYEGARLVLREGVNSFGRLPSNDLVLVGDLVSRHHLRITFFEGRATLQDLGSHNGTWVNDERVTTRIVREADIIRVGNFRLTFCEGPLAAADLANFEESTARAAPDIHRDEDRDLDQTHLPDAHASSSRALRLLYRASEALEGTDNLQSFLENLLDLALDHTHASSAVFFRLDPGAAGAEPVAVTARGENGRSDTALRPMGIVRWVTAKNFAVMSGDITRDLRFGEGAVTSAEGARAEAVMCVPAAGREGMLGAVYASRAATPFTEPDLDLLIAIAHLSVMGIERIGLKKRATEDAFAREKLSRFHSPDVLGEILKNGDRGGEKEPRLEGKTATILSCDIDSVDTLARDLGVARFSHFLNTYVDGMASILIDRRGTIERFSGAGILGVFGAPCSLGNDAARAVSAALEMRDAFDALAAHTFPELMPRRLRVGISTGSVFVGTIGSARRLEYTVLGDAVSAAQRLKIATTPGSVLISNATYPLVRDRFDLRRREGPSTNLAERTYEVVAGKGRS